MAVLDQISVLTTPVSIAVTATLFVSAYLFYRWLLPQPIPGIPYNEESAKSLFGDIPGLLNHLKGSKIMTDWMQSHNNRHNSPIVQIFTKLFGRPWVVISDYREAQDIVMRRTKEFDKPDTISDIFYAVAPDHHTVQPTNDRWRAQRKLMQDLMSPPFLNGVAAPQLHASFSELIKLWTEKLRLSEGRPFAIKMDIYDAALDAIWAAVFGMEGTKTVTQSQVDLLSSLPSIDLPASKDKEAVLPKAEPPPEFDAILKLTDSLEHVVKSPMPRMVGLYQRYFDKTLRAHQKVKEVAVQAQITAAEKRLNENDKSDKIQAAIDHMMRREKMAAAKQGRKPEYHSRYMSDELFGLLIAGHDTTSTTLNWALKLLSHHQDVQAKLRKALEAAFSTARSEQRAPSAAEIANSQIHYFDACLEEILRHSQTAPVTSRQTTTDAVVLGRVIPKGTRVMMMTNGNGVLMPAYKISDNIRSESYRAADGGKVGVWDAQDIKLFNPERWLVGEGDNKVFDSQAGPHMLFGGGPRGCFGKRLAYLELRLVLVLIMWSFVMEEVPEEYADWEPIEQLTHSPVYCYVKLRKV